MHATQAGDQRRPPHPLITGDKQMNLNEMSFKDVAAIVAFINGSGASSNDV